jgi:AcrR family transcriptional regulator
VQFFGSKQHLFRAATMPPAQIRRALEAALGGDPDHAGERLAEMFVALLEDHDERTAIVARIRSAASEPAAAALVRETVGGALAEAAAELGGNLAQVRAALIASQFVGLVMVREIVAIEPLATLPAEDVVRLIAPALQQSLSGPLDG